MSKTKEQIQREKFAKNWNHTRKAGGPVFSGYADNPTERNGWLVSDTAHCEPGRQVRDRTGELDPHALYDRVTEWIAGKPSVVPGGIVRDGAYRIVSGGKDLGIETGKQGAPGALLGERSPDRSPNGLFWFYHLGGSRYRIIAVHSGLALEASEAGIIQDWDTTEASQRWTVSRAKDGLFTVKNEATGEAFQWRLQSVVKLL